MKDSFFKKYSKHSLILFFILIVLLAFYTILSYLTAILAAAIIVYVFYPEFKRLNKHIKSRSICALIMLAVILLIIVIPLFFVINALAVEAVGFYQNVKVLDLTPVSESITKFLGENIDINSYVKSLGESLVSFIARLVSDFFISLPQKILILFVTVFVMYYFFKDGDKIIAFLEKVLPMYKDHKTELLAEFNRVIHATIYGVLVSAVIQGLIGTLGLVIFQVSSPIIWGSIMTLTAMLPFIGTGLIWVPAALFKIVNGDFFNGFGLLLYGILIISTIDNIIKPKLISTKSQTHPVLIILGIFGGLKAFGIIGIIIGPLLLATLSVLYNFYMNKK